MKTVLKHIVGRTYKPFLEKWLSKTRPYRQGNLDLDISPDVFHPGFFSSTQFLWNFLSKENLIGKKLLELGAGSGFIAMRAYKRGAIVTATDINAIAIGYLRSNSAKNDCSLQIIHSDMFEQVPAQTFDIIAINPPYYKKDPVAPIEFAWYCGEDGAYFRKLFEQLGSFIHANSEVYMVCCDGCDLQMIRELARTHGYQLHCKRRKPTVLETNFIFKIEVLP